jgi:hypothetical protein
MKAVVPGTIVASVVAAWLPLAACAAPADTLRLRIDSRPGRGFALAGDSLAFVRDGGTDTIRIPLAGIRRLEIARTTQSHFWSGAGIGLFAGSVIGWIAGYSQGDDPIDPNCLLCSLLTTTAEEKGAAGAIAGGLVGSVVGGLSGLAYRTPRWRPVGAEDLRVTLVPGRGSELRLALVWKPSLASR